MDRRWLRTTTAERDLAARCERDCRGYAMSERERHAEAAAVLAPGSVADPSTIGIHASLASSFAHQVSAKPRSETAEPDRDQLLGQARQQGLFPFESPLACLHHPNQEFRCLIN